MFINHIVKSKEYQNRKRCFLSSNKLIKYNNHLKAVISYSAILKQYKPMDGPVMRSKKLIN